MHYGAIRGEKFVILHDSQLILKTATNLTNINKNVNKGHIFKSQCQYVTVTLTSFLDGSTWGTDIWHGTEDLMLSEFFLGRKRSHSIVTCLECGEIKRFCTKSHHLWSMQPEAWKIAPYGIVDNCCQHGTNTDSTVVTTDSTVVT